MRIKKQNLYLWLFYAMIAAYMFGPSLSYRFGLPRIDNPMTILLTVVMILVALFELKNIHRKAVPALLGIAMMGGWSSLHLLLTPMSSVQLMDTMFFMSLPALFYLLYLVLRGHQNPLQFIRKILTIFTLCMVVPPAIEVVTGFQFTAANELLTVDSGVIKGLFFNPNNLGTSALCFSTAILMFFNIEADSKQKRWGFLLFLLLGAIIFASASRTATLCYIILFILNLVYRGNIIFTGLTGVISGILLSMIPKEMIGSFLLSLNGNVFLENISSRLYLFLFDLESDNSVGYRQEIYNYFWNHPPFLVLGYGPKNFREYFGGHLSDSLGFENPHSFIIELYLSFGLVSFAGFALYVVYYLFQTASSRRFNSKQRFIGLAAMALFLLAGFIPSTIFRMPFIWLPCFMIFIYSILPPTQQHTAATIKPYR